MDDTTLQETDLIDFQIWLNTPRTPGEFLELRRIIEKARKWDEYQEAVNSDLPQIDS